MVFRVIQQILFCCRRRSQAILSYQVNEPGNRFFDGDGNGFAPDGIQQRDGLRIQKRTSRLGLERDELSS
jgi:hypothetical protein